MSFEVHRSPRRHRRGLVRAGRRGPAPTSGRTSCSARSCAAAPSPTCRRSPRPTRRRARWSASTSTCATRSPSGSGVTAKITPLSVEARVPEVKLGRVDMTVANLAYTLGRAEQIQFSDPYYLAKEMLAVKASDPGTTKADFKGKRLASTKGSTSELSIKMNGSEPRDLPGHRLGLHGRAAEQGARHGGQHDDDHQARQPVQDHRRRARR